MKITVCTTCVLLWSLLLPPAETGRINDDELLIHAAAHVSKLHRVTERPFKMDVRASVLCVAPGRPKNGNPGDPHQDSFCHVFVSEPGVEPMKSGQGEYPVGTVIVKQKFSDKQAKTVELFTLMRKMEAGYDPDHGDWEYSIVNRRATKVLSRGRTESCIECHKQHRETDFVTRLYLPAPDAE